MTVAKDHQVADPVRTEGAFPQKALEVARQLESDPKNAELWKEYGLELARGMFMRESVEAFSRAIALEPFEGILYRHRGHRHLSCWEFAEAAADFEVAARLIPENWDVWYHLGLSYYLLGEYDDAQHAYKRCLELTDMSDIEAFPAIIDWSWRTARRRGDEAYAKELLELLPVDFPVGTDECGYALNCAVYQGRKTPEEALEVCAGQDPLHAATNSYAMANYFNETGDAARSKEQLEKLIADLDAEGWCTFGYLAAMQDLKRMAL